MKKDPIKNEGARVVTTLYVNFSDGQGQITPKSMMVSGRNLNSPKLSFMFLSPARMKMIQSKMKGLEWSQYFSHYTSMQIFPDAQGQLILDVINVLITCKNKEDPIKNESARVITRFSPL